MFVHYFDSTNEPNCFVMTITVPYKNAVKIEQFPNKPAEKTVFDVNDLPPQVLQLLTTTNDKGVIPLSDEEIAKIINTYKDKIEFQEINED